MDLVVMLVGWGLYKAFMFFGMIIAFFILIAYAIVKGCMDNPQDFKKANDIERRRLNRLGLKNTFCDSSSDYTVLDRATEYHVNRKYRERVDESPPLSEEEQRRRGYIKFGIVIIVLLVSVYVLAQFK